MQTLQIHKTDSKEEDHNKKSTSQYEENIRKKLNNKIKTLLWKSHSYNDLKTKYKISELYKKYPFLKKQEYDNLREFFSECFQWKSKEIEFLWEWINGFVIEHPKDKTKVIKIWKYLKDDIPKEFKCHDKIFRAFSKLEKETWLNTADVKIPKILYQMWDTFFQMERIFGQTFKTKFYIEKYQEEIKQLWIDEQEFPYLKDNQLEEILKMMRVERLPDPEETNDNELQEEYEQWWKEKYEEKLDWDLKKVKGIVDTIGLYQDEDEEEIYILDRNAWNIMQTPEGVTYLIDFWHLN